MPALITTLHQLYEESGGAEAFGLALALGTYSGVATVVLLASVLDLLANLNYYMQRKATNFSKLPVILESIVSELKHLKSDKAEWCSLTGTTVTALEKEHGITLRSSCTRRGSASATTMNEYRRSVAILYIDTLISNIDSRFSDAAVKLLVSASVFHPASLPTDETEILEYGKGEIQTLVNFYGKEATMEFDGKTYTSPPLVDGEEILAEWVFKRALAKETKALMTKRKLPKPPTLQDVKAEMETSAGYPDIFPEVFKLINILLTLPVGTATVKRSFSQLKLVKTRLRSQISDSNLTKLMRIAIEGLDLARVDFNEIVDVFKEKNHRISL